MKTFEKKRLEFEEKLELIKEGEATLRAHSINNKNEIDAIKQEVILQKTNMQKIPITINDGKLIEVATIDSHAKLLYDKIVELEEETKGFDESEFSKLKTLIRKKQNEHEEVISEIGSINGKIKDAQDKTKKLES